MNILEATLNLEYLYLRYTSPHSSRSTPTSANRPRYHAHAPVVGLVAATMTVSKTILYFLQGECLHASQRQKTCTMEMDTDVCRMVLWMVYDGT
jgi:hypothetical protein